jgi:hypothetical protein
VVERLLLPFKKQGLKSFAVREATISFATQMVVARSSLFIAERLLAPVLMSKILNDVELTVEVFLKYLR